LFVNQNNHLISLIIVLTLIFMIPVIDMIPSFRSGLLSGSWL